MAKRVRKRNKKRMRAFAMGFVALAFIIAAVLISQQKKLDAIAEEQEVIAAQNEEKARLEYMIEYSGSESYLIQYAREKLGYVRPDEIKFDIDGNK